MHDDAPYRFSRAQLFALVLCSISFGLNGALTAIFVAEARGTAALSSGLATMGMVAAMWAMLRLGRRAQPVPAT